MPLQSISPVGMETISPSAQTGSTQRISPYNAQQNFADMLKDSINEVNEAQLSSDDMTNKLVKGENVELHDVMIASQKASISLSLTMQVRNKAVEAYQEIMRMPV
ncbi:flagellar hook-basal body protein FliE [Jeotgalibacillus campisalis]|uniref:Flagellar hook-basal body complex protein FliE n=2 Tax=Jeotgalibacillus campisalis TaxID=220754 RepID=A0A0C2VUN0_9BACL|nr:flagellar hook-basal body protein FliE [Jeotgalibacillus campisalis]